MVGEGFDLGGASSYIETSYKPCAKVNPTSWGASGDMCLGVANATISGGSHAGQLVRDDTDNAKWRLSTDDGTRVQLLTGTTGGTNGSGVLTSTGLTDNTSTYWKLTAADGTVYLYGANRLPSAGYNGNGNDSPTYSTWSIPVFGTGSGTSCNDPTSTVEPQNCLQPWRWNLDFVIDPHGNVTRYSYAREFDNYQHKTATTSYTRSGFLREIDYGWQTSDLATSTGTLADGNAAGPAPASTVQFRYAPRCVYDATNNPTCPTTTPTVSGGKATTGIIFPGDPGTSNTSAFLDVPSDQHCTTGSTSCTVYSPAYFSTVRLTSLQTAVNTGASSGSQPSGTPVNYAAVDTYTLTQSFPQPQDFSSTGNRAQLRLESVKHTGYLKNSDGTVATTNAQPVLFGYDGTKPNRVQASWNSLSVGSTAPLFYRYRLNDVIDELGAETVVVYQRGSTAQDCTGLSSAPPTTIANTTLCYPEYFNNNGTMVTDWYNKYVVAGVTVNDDTLKGLGYVYSKPHTNNYSYLGNPAWHTNDSEQADSAYRTVDGFRGFSQVQTTTSGETGGQNAKTVTTYFQGMDQDPSTYRCLNDSHSQAPANTSCPGGYGYRDDNALMGQALEVQTYASDTSSTVVSDVITVPEDPTDAGMVTATHVRVSPLPAQRAHFSHIQHKYTYEQVSTSTTPRRSEVDYTYDNSLPTFSGSGGTGGNGHLILTDDKGDGTVQELCTTTAYAINTALGGDGTQWTAYPDSSIIFIPSAPQGCAAGAQTATNTVSQTQTLYDGQSYPTILRGDVTATQAAPSLNAAWVTTSQAGYDSYGRATSKTDANGNTTRTSFNTAPGLLPVQVTTTNPAGWTSNANIDRGRGVTETNIDVNGRQSDATYDGLGRVVKAWSASHTKAANPTTPVQIFTYGMFGGTYGTNGATPNPYVGTQTLREDNSYAASYSILDAFGEQIQTQSTPVDNSAGLVFTQAEYNSLGKPYRTAAPDPDSGHSPSGTFINYVDALPSETITTYDGLSRPLTVTTYHNGSPLTGAVTTTAYPGVDRTDVTAPAGNGVAAAGATSTFTDVRGRTTALWTYHNSPPSPTGNAADADRSTYTFSYVAGGTTTTVTDATGQNTWTTTTTDLLGRHVVKTDPDAGTSNTWSDNAGQLLQSTDGRGQTLSFIYDNLGRKTAEYNASSTELTLDGSGNITAINTAATPPAASTQLAGWSFDTAPGSDGKTDRGLPVTSTRYTGGGANAYTQAVSGYDAGGRPTGATVTIPPADNNGLLAGTYTTNNYYTPVTGLLDHVDLPVGGGLPAETIYNSYNVNGLLMATGGNADYIVDTAYDQLGRTLSRTLGDYPYQVVEQNLYDPATSRVTNTFIDATAGQNSANTSQLNTYTADEITYAYDPAGRITSVADLQNHTISGTYSPGASARDNQCFTYDYAGRLTNAWADTGDQTPPSAPTDPTSPSTATGAIGSCADSTTNNPPTSYTALGGPAPYWQSYTFDNTGATGLGNGALTGNRSTIKDHATTSTGTDTTRTSTFPAAHTVNNAGGTPSCTATGYTCGPHQLTTVNVTGGTTGTDTYSYDGAGNMTTRTVNTQGSTGNANETLTWNAEGRLATVANTTTSTTASFTYDASGNQLIRRDYTTGTTNGTATLYLGNTEIQLTTSGTTNSLSGRRYYTYPGAPRIVADNTGTITYEIANDQNTANTTINAANGQISARRYSKPYGDPRGTGTSTTFGGFPDDHTFLGKTADTSTGLVDIGARKYDPQIGRFISADPLFQAGDPQSISGYAYADNNPVDGTDPTGLGNELQHYGSKASEHLGGGTPATVDVGGGLYVSTDDPRFSRFAQHGRAVAFAGATSGPQWRRAELTGWIGLCDDPTAGLNCGSGLLAALNGQLGSLDPDHNWSGEDPIAAFADGSAVTLPGVDDTAGEAEAILALVHSREGHAHGFFAALANAGMAAAPLAAGGGGEEEEKVGASAPSEAQLSKIDQVTNWLRSLRGDLRWNRNSGRERTAGGLEAESDGVVFDPWRDGLLSGHPYDGYVPPAGAVYPTHAEPQAVAIMDALDIKEADLYISKGYVCDVCQATLPDMLPTGAKLTVHFPGPDSPLTFIGN